MSMLSSKPVTSRRNPRLKQLLIDGIVALFILLWVYAAVNKLLDYEKFAVQIGQSPLLTDISGFVAWFIPAVEIIVSGLLAWPRSRLVGLYASFTLMVMFTGYIIAILGFSDNIPCSCGGVLEKLGWTEHLVFNIGFVLLAGVGIFMEKK
ncbi:hypothetical protein OOZ15_13580 [Galbibacter sp. EGI 63066]|uniref:MauE/DoxX family redox-associated membrane protein n=1 Tax=Galbibacter sp. EGI 63066 TaxID=2993559 RepID=UPI0022499E38|nr:MauE/DoxX family redox-associated membrane protein [Galbibacter sp. EGI 63066]MCX2680979.1 hypothetical protein [Galbibacter sp. EGI 63066]